MSQETGTAVAETQELAGKYQTFKLGSEEYGLEIMKVREIIGLMDITDVPRTPEHIRGVINLRGKIIPVLDLRMRFGMAKCEDQVKILLNVAHVLSLSELAEVNQSVQSFTEKSEDDSETTQ